MRTDPDEYAEHLRHAGEHDLDAPADDVPEEWADAWREYDQDDE